MKHAQFLSSLSVFSLLFWIPVFALGCQCGSTETQEDPPAADRTETGTPQEPEALVPDEPGVSAEVQALIDAGDAQAIAADMETRVTRCRTLAAATGEDAKQLETVAESMTGRSESVNPRDAAAVTQLVTAADQIATGATELSAQVTELQQLVTDLKAEADALYGRPSL